MNKKVLLNVLLPATQHTYDFWVPADMTLHDAAQLIKGSLEAREDDFYVASSTTSFASQETGDLLEQDKTLEALEFVDGTQLVLV